MWENVDGQWKQTLVIPRINRAATCVKWSPKEDKFAVGSGSRLIAVCYYDEDNNWWISRHIKKPIRSTVTCLDWHPNNILVAAGSTDFKCRIFSAYLKEIEAKPEATNWGKKMMFGNCMAEFSNGGGGWVHSVSFSPSGDKVAWVGHDSSVSVVRGGEDAVVSVIKGSFLPMMSISWISEFSLVAAGYDCNPMVFSYDESNTTKLVAKLDQPQEKETGQISAMNRFKNLDKRASSGETTTNVKTQHQNTILQVSIHTGTKADVSKIATTGVDGNLILWDLKSLEQKISELKIV